MDKVVSFKSGDSFIVQRYTDVFLVNYWSRSGVFDMFKGFVKFLTYKGLSKHLPC